MSRYSFFSYLIVGLVVSCVGNAVQAQQQQVMPAEFYGMLGTQETQQQGHEQPHEPQVSVERGQVKEPVGPIKPMTAAEIEEAVRNRRMGTLDNPAVNASDEQMRIDMNGSMFGRTKGDSEEWTLRLRMQADNQAHPTLWYRSWWYAEVGPMAFETPQTINVEVVNAGISSKILPVWSLNGGPFVRLPESTVITREGQRNEPRKFTFTVEVPPRTVWIRIAKFFPYTIRDKNAFLATLEDDPRVKMSVTGQSNEGRNIERVDITDPNTPDTNKRRVWIHSLVHPSETTSAFVLEGMIPFLLSDGPAAKTLLENCIFNIVPMMNPDGVYHGNYRVNTNLLYNEGGTNLEDEWEFPWQPREDETRSIKDDIEKFMGTVDSPESNPIEILLNLHSAHGDYPFHFVHDPDWAKPGDQGVNQEVHDIEIRWVEFFRARNQMVAMGRDSKSKLLRDGRRVFIEAMMFDRYSSNPAWRKPPNNLPPVMAITFEGTYSYGPPVIEDGELVKETWATPDDYRQIGRDMALTIGDYFDLPMPKPEPFPLPEDHNN